MNKRYRCPVLVFVLAVPLNGFAASTESPLLEEVVVSSRVPVPLRQVATAVSVVTVEDLHARGVNGLADALRFEPSVALSNTGGAGQPTAIRIRGEEGFRTLVRIDGIEVGDPSGVQVLPNIEHLLSNGIHRVEILRGPQGMMYGADAGGVIDISTPRSTEALAGDISAEGGRHGTRQLAANLGGRSSAFDYHFSATDFTTDGFNARSDDRDLADDDGYDNTTLHGRFGWNLDARWRLEAVLRDTDAEADYDNCFDSATFALIHDCQSEFEQRSYRLAASFSGERFQHQWAWAQTDISRDFFSAGQRAFGFEGENTQLEYLGTTRLDEFNSLVFGIDYKDESMEDDSQDPSREQTGAYLEYQYRFEDRLFLTAGARHDDNDDFGNHTSYRVSAAYLVPAGAGSLKFKTSYGTGFRAPSLYEMSYNSGPFAFPPALGITLDEEQTEGVDVGVEYFTENGVHLEAVYFYQTVEDEIFFDEVGFSGYLQGDGEAESRGLELVGLVPVGNQWQLTANYTWNDAERADGDERFRRPEHVLNAGISYRGLDERLALHLYLRAARDAVEFDGSELDDYEVLNLSASYRFTTGLELYGRVENLTDENYREVPFYNTAGAAGYAGLRWSF